MADKDVDGIVDALTGASALLGATVIATTLDAARAMPADELAARWRRRGRRVSDVQAVTDPLEAVERSRARGGLTVVAGSLYLVGQVRAHLIDDPELRDPPAP
jgi:folylpolyglutamate synthase/dihydropteroate synthase